MDGSRPGEAGVIAWCNSIRFTMAKDPGRQFLHEQIQREGFDFLDLYLENFMEGPRKECVCYLPWVMRSLTCGYRLVIELLKTPGRKKNVAGKTRAATTAAVKIQTITSMSLEEVCFDP